MDNPSPDYETGGEKSSVFSFPGEETTGKVEHHPNGMFSALQNRNFRLFWGGAFIANIGNWMQTIAMNWLVLSLTNSPFLLGLVIFIGNLPMLFLSMYGGVIADRHSRRNILLVTQGFMFGLILSLAILTYTGVINIWLLVVIVILFGIVQAFNAPAYQTLMLDLVGKEHLLNAIALNSVQFNLSRIIGPSLAGVLVVTLGVAACFFTNVATYTVVLLALYLVRIPATTLNNTRKSAILDIKESLDYIRQERNLVGLMIISAAFSIVIFPYLSLLSVFAKDVYKSSADAYGILMAGVGGGAVIGGLIVAKLSNMEKHARFIQVGAVILVLGLIVFALMPTVFLALPFLAVAGGAMVTLQSSVNSVVQSNVPDTMRGRVISIWQLTAFGLLPFGSLLGGTLAEFIGAPSTIVICTVIFALVTLLVFIKYRGINKL
jgi:MFS family permease